MSVDSYNLKTPHLSMVPATAMLFRDELKRAFSTLERTRIEPEILPPEVNIRIPLINYTSLAYTPYELANELFLHVEELWTKHLRIISGEAQDYHAQHGFYPWEEESAAGPGDAAAAPDTAPKADPHPPAEAKNMPAGPPDPDPGTNMLGYLFYGENAWISELDWGAIKNDLREAKESLLAQAVALLQGLQQTLARAEGREAAAGAGESTPEAKLMKPAELEEGGPLEKLSQDWRIIKASGIVLIHKYLELSDRFLAKEKVIESKPEQQNANDATQSQSILGDASLPWLPPGYNKEYIDFTQKTCIEDDREFTELNASLDQENPAHVAEIQPAKPNKAWKEPNFLEKMYWYFLLPYGHPYRIAKERELQGYMKQETEKWARGMMIYGEVKNSKSANEYLGKNLLRCILNALNNIFSLSFKK